MSHDRGGAGDTSVCVLVVRADGMILGGSEYDGGPVVAARYSDDPAELRRRIAEALDSAGTHDAGALLAK